MEIERNGIKRENIVAIVGTRTFGGPRGETTFITVNLHGGGTEVIET